MNQNRIGIFDSGVGGLTVLRAIERQLPRESVLYFGDTARLPYGNRSEAEIVQFVREILTWMAAEGVKMVLMACNTSSALALEIVRDEVNFPILGLILPGAKAAVEAGRRIGVIATAATVASDAYRRAILEVENTASVWQIPCPKFVPLIEDNRIFDPYTEEVTWEYLAPLVDANIDTLIYGCTHYPLLEPVVRSLLSDRVRLVDPAVHLVAAAARELELLGLRSTSTALPTRFGVSGDPDSFANLSVRWLGYTPTVEKVVLPQVEPSFINPLRP